MARRLPRGRLAVVLLPMLLLAPFALAGCGLGGMGAASPTATPTIPSAAAIIQRAQNVKITDAAFTMTFTGVWSDQAISGTATGRLTENPPRYDITLTYNSGGTYTSNGQQLVFETIGDGTTNATYTKLVQPAALATGKWTKTAGGTSSSLFDALQFTDYSQIQHPTVAGTDIISGVAVWHLKGRTTAAGATGGVDLFIRQDNYEPVRIEGLILGSLINANAVLTFTSMNAGTISISLPPADQVLSA